MILFNTRQSHRFLSFLKTTSSYSFMSDGRGRFPGGLSKGGMWTDLRCECDHHYRFSMIQHYKTYMGI